MSKKHKRRASSKSIEASTLKGNVVNPTPGSQSRFSQGAEFNPDYSYVVSDLKRIGILALTFTVILVVVSFFIQ